LVEITGIEIMEIGDKFMFPFSERVYITTSAREEEVSKWVKPLMADKILEDWLYGVKPELATEVSEDSKVYSVYWD
jgi:hypothetical protein